MYTELSCHMHSLTVTRASVWKRMQYMTASRSEQEPSELPSDGIKT